MINPNSNVINYTMGNPNGQFVMGTPIDFMAAEQYLKCASAFWSTLMPNGTGQVIYGQLNLTGTDESLNIFSLDSGNLLELAFLWLSSTVSISLRPWTPPSSSTWMAPLFSTAATRSSATVRPLPGNMRAGSCGISPGSVLVQQHHRHLRFRTGTLCRSQYHLQPDQWQYHF